MNADDEIIAAARACFMDEAQEMLAQFEAALLVMESDPADSENLNAAFRAAHTIKGSAGLFGFDAVVAFTHEVETLLEALRCGELAVSETLAALLLQSRDQMELLLDEVRTGGRSAGLAAASEALAAQLRACRGAAADAGGDAGLLAGAAATFAADPAAGAAPDGQGVWHLSLRFARDTLRNGMDPLSFIRYLATVGTVLQVRLLHEQVPSLEEIDPEGCHLAFEIGLATAADRRTIADVFEFVADDCDLALLAPAAPGAEFAALLERRCAAAADPAAERETLLAVWRQMGVAPAAPAAAAAAVTAPVTAPTAAIVAAPAEAMADDHRGVADGDRRPSAGRRAGDEARFIRVRADKLDRLIDLIGELVIASSGAQLVAQTEQSAPFAEAALRIHDLVQEARDGALGLRMVPISETFSRFARVVRDVSKQMGKDVDLQITGGDTELDKSMVDTIADPLMHLVRNSLDHGIELPAERVAAGKRPQGRLALHAYHESGSILIEVSDDGRGLDRGRILAKAVERGLVAPDAEPGDDAVHQLIFAPGFSTAAAVTNLSGRGVGMDVVKRNIESLRGQIRIASQPGRGATMQIRLPLTLAIIDGFLTSVGGVSYVLPLELVAECLEVPPEYHASHADHADPTRVAGHFDLRGELLPYLDIGRFYRHAPPPAGTRRSLLLVRDGASRIGLIVDRLHGEHQTVIKPLGEVFRHIRGLAGSTILGSGEVALILDVPALLALATACAFPPSIATHTHTPAPTAGAAASAPHRAGSAHRPSAAVD